MSRMLAERLALVTGGGSGIGRQVCKILAREGAKIIAADKNLLGAQETITTLEGKGHIALGVNVTDIKNIKTVYKNIITSFQKPPTIVVNCAGITRDNFILKLEQKDFDDVINVNLKGTFNVTQIAVKALVEADVTNGSSIVNVASIIGKTGNIGQCNYSASKAGVEALTKTASMEFGTLGVRVNAVLPGFIKTPLIESIPDNVSQMFIKRIALKRIGAPEEVAEVIAFLASDKSSYVNGACIEVTGGFF